MKKIVLLLLMLFYGFSNFAVDVQRVEPLNWWVGMKNNNLQLLIYGKQIAECEILFDYPGVILESTVRVSNPNYLFLNLKISEFANAGWITFQFRKGKKSLLKYKYQLKDRRIGSANRKGFNSADVIYLLMPDRFANGDKDNDSCPEVIEKADRTNPNGRHGGDIAGIIEHLDYLKDLGVTALWSTPLTTDDEKVYSYHGYAASDLYHIDPRFGTNEDYCRLSEELHKRDMKLIMDFVPNHWGLNHWLIQDLPAQNWIHYWKGEPNGFKRSNYIQITQFDPNVAKIDADGCMKGWFDRTMPDMNEENPLVMNYLVQNAVWWIETADLDGLRIDTYPYNGKRGIAEWTRRVMNEYPFFNMVGEAFLTNPVAVSYWQKDSPISAIEGYNSYLPSVMDFSLFNLIASSIITSDSIWGQGFHRLYGLFAEDFLYSDVNDLLVFMGNHDVTRINQKFNGDLGKYKLALAVILTIRGIPQLYYGDEIGMLGDKSRGDGDIRRDFPGGWANDSINAFRGDEQTTLQNEYFSYTRKLLQWRKRSPVIFKGKTMHFIPENNLYVYFRYYSNQSVMVVLNKNHRSQTLLTDRFKEMLKSYTHGTDIISDQTISDLSKIQVFPYSAMIVELQK